MANQSRFERQWALEGAQGRLTKLRTEIEEILRVFPELGRGGPKSREPRRSRRAPTAAERKAISAGMRKAWARRKAEQAKSGKHASS